MRTAQAALNPIRTHSSIPKFTLRYLLAESARITSKMAALATGCIGTDSPFLVEAVTDAIKNTKEINRA